MLPPIDMSWHRESERVTMVKVAIPIGLADGKVETSIDCAKIH
jgi:hypothetical protein